MAGGPNVKAQVAENAGLSGGVLVSVLHEPFDCPGGWELFKACQPDGVSRSHPHEPRSEAGNRLGAVSRQFGELARSN